MIASIRWPRRAVEPTMYNLPFSSFLKMLGARLASIESELAADDVDEELLPPAKSASPAPPLGSASPGADGGPEAAPQRTSQAKPASGGGPPPQPSDDREDFL